MKSLEFRKNSFTLLRYIACAQVIIGHINFCMQLNIDEKIIGITMMFQGVPVFFILSGYLIWITIENYANFKTYIRKRMLRIYPELWMAVFVSIISIIVLYKPIDFKQLCLFAVTQGTVLQFWTPSFLRDYGVGTPNGSLWTICIFVQFYVIIWFIHKILRGRGMKRWIITLLLAVAFDVTYPITEKLFNSEILYKLYGMTILPFLYLFLLGSFIAEYKDKIVPIIVKYWYVFAGAEAIVVMTNMDLLGRYYILHTTFLAFFIIGFAYRFLIKIEVDISYELYLVHGIVLNVFVEKDLIGWKYVFFALVISILLSMIMRLSYKSIMNKEIARNFK